MRTVPGTTSVAVRRLGAPLTRFREVGGIGDVGTAQTPPRRRFPAGTSAARGARRDGRRPGDGRAAATSFPAGEVTSC